MYAPRFWQHHGVLPRALAPISAIVAAAAARRVARPSWRSPVPVLCCGNVTVGGTGKTTLALDIGARLKRRGIPFAFITRGYGGRVLASTRVNPLHTAAIVGDEALLLASVGQTWVGADRAASARCAIANAAEVLVMDDGLQNPDLAQDLALLVIDGATGFGNGHVLPAGPLREPIAACAVRCHAAVVIGPDATNAAMHLTLPVLRATLTSDADWVAGRRMLAFAGIGRPSKFFNTLVEAGAELVGQVGFPDHHRYRPAELRRLLRRSVALDAVLVTTPKDAVRLPPAMRNRVKVADVALRWEDPFQIEALLDARL